VRETFLDELGPENGPLWEAFVEINAISYSAVDDHLLQRDDSPFWDNIHTPDTETKAQIIAQSLQKAMALCEKEMGKDREQWQWGKLHTYHWRHEATKKTIFFHDYLNRGPYPAGGDSHTINMAASTPGKDFNVWLIPAMRFVVDFGKEEPARLITVPGESGNPSSPHYSDMVPYYLKGENHPLPFQKEAVEKQYNHVLLLKKTMP